MAFSYVDLSAIGPGQSRAIPFPYISEAHLTVTVGGVVVSPSLYTIVGGYTLQTGASFPTGDGRVRRNTPIDSYSSIQSGTSSLDWEGMKDNFTVTLYVLQEYVDAEDERDAVVAGVDAALSAALTDINTKLGLAQAAASSASSLAIAAANSASQAAYSASVAATFNPSSYYLKTEIDTGFYTKSAVDSAVGGRVQGSLDTDGTMASNSDTSVPSQKAVRTYVSGAVGSIQAVPAGEVSWFAGSSAPTGYLKANGALVSRTAYAALYAAIGTTYGAGDGSTTFKLPDLRGEFIRGWDDARGIDAGRALGSWQDSDNKSHSHTGTTDTQGAHSHTVTISLSAGSGNLPWSGAGSNLSSTSTSSAGNHSHNLTIASSGGPEARPRNIALLACIKY